MRSTGIMRNAGRDCTPSCMIAPMPVFRLDDALRFPDPELADETGLLAVGGDLRVDRLLLAYRHGIFPWYEEGLPILWHSPDPRMVLDAAELHVGRSLRRVIRRGEFEIRFDTAFSDVMGACAQRPRPGQDGTWITADMMKAYRQLHELGWAHSVEAWHGGALVGGLYGVSIGRAFFGESMFAAVDDGSKVAFVALVERLHRWDIRLVDCQVHTEHLARFGARLMPRADFLNALAATQQHPTRLGSWSQGDPP